MDTQTQEILDKIKELNLEVEKLVKEVNRITKSIKKKEDSKK